MCSYFDIFFNRPSNAVVAQVKGLLTEADMVRLSDPSSFITVGAQHHPLFGKQRCKRAYIKVSAVGGMIFKLGDVESIIIRASVHSMLAQEVIYPLIYPVEKNATSL